MAEAVASGRSDTLRTLRPAADAPSRDLPDIAARALIGGLFLALAWRLGMDFAETRRVTSLLMLTSEALVVLFTLARRHAFTVDRSIRARLVTAVALLGPFLVRPAPTPGIASEAIAATISGCGLLFVIAAKLTLGRSFGVLPANRGIVASGVYGLVRHPIYAGYLLNDVGFLCSHSLGWNVLVLGASAAAQVWRLLLEERTLVHDPEYAAYVQRVKWRLVPLVF